MVETPKKKTSAYVEAGTLLAAAIEQLSQIRKALAASPSNTQLESASGRARDAVSQIQAAIRSGTLDESSLASLSAALNIGVDSGALATEAERGGVALAKAQLAVASLQTHTTVERIAADVFDRHEFDADVARHTHGAGLEAFKRREAADAKFIKQQLAHGTPEGDLNASERMERYMLDANAHGAGDNAAFMAKWNDLKTKTERLRESMRAAGLSTEEHDRQIKQDVTDFLKSKGLSDRQIKDALAKNENPVDAVQPYLDAGKDSQGLANKLQKVSSSEDAGHAVAIKAPAVDEPLNIDPDAIDARLAAAGLRVGASGEVTGHGLSTQKSQTNVVER